MNRKVMIEQLSSLVEQLSGGRPLDSESDLHLSSLARNKVPDNWIADLDLSTTDIDTYTQTFRSYSGRSILHTAY